MSTALWQNIGSISLITLIVFTLGMLVIMAIRKMWYWFTAFTTIALTIIAAEIWSFLARGHSISTHYGIWLNNDPLWASVALMCFTLAMISLVLHLVAYAFKRKRK